MSSHDETFPSADIEWENMLTVLESIDEVIYVADPDTYELLYMNPAIIDSFGSGTGEKCYKVLQDRDSPCPFCTNDVIFADDAELPHIWLFQNRMNDRWYKCIDRTIRWSDGRLVRFEIAIDINDRILAEEALKENEEKFRVMVNASFDAIYLESVDGEVLDCNRAACEMLGYSRDELIGMNAGELLPEDRLKDLPGIMEKLRETGKSFLKGRNLRKDGTAVPVESWARVIDTSEGERVLVYVRDITERLESQRELMESEKRFRSFMDQLPAAVFLKDSHSRYLYINPYMREVFNADEGWIGSATEECFPSKEADLLVRDDRDALEKGYTVDIQNVVDRSGNERVFETHKFRISKSPERSMLGGIALDITNRVKAEKAQQNLEAQIQHTQKLESLGVLAGGIAHDFNNILMAILGYADLALQDIPGKSEARSSILEIEKAARNAADLTKQMLAYSGKGKFQVIKIDVNEIIREMTHLLEISISKKAVIKFNLEEDLPPIEGDPSQIRQIIMNLITNASDAMEDTSGVISITTNVMECDKEYLSTTYISGEIPEGEYVYIEVADNGCGMEERTLKKLFDPFYTTKFEGRGLGLSAVLGIVRGHSGTIKVYSEPGKGTSFKIFLPAAKGKPVFPEENSETVSKVSSGTTVFLVDDEESIRNIGRKMLERRGYEVILASDGREAVDIFREKHNEIDCVVLDLTMPHMDGEEAFREMRRIDGSVRVIISSGYNRQDVTQRFVGKGLAGFIQKPYRLSELLEKLNRLME